MSKLKRVLLVDDDDSLRTMLREQLQLHEDFDVLDADGATSALDQVKQGAFDVIILDVGLPDMDGRDVLRAASNMCPDCKIVVITAHGSINIAVDAMREGAWDFLLKPFTARLSLGPI